MKGLLIKDFKLMLMQKNFFIIIIVVACLISISSQDPTFMIGFITLILSLFTVSTISYDEFDNGNAFLFTLPITRTSYVMEKYCLGLLAGCGTWIFATILGMIATVFKGTLTITDLIMIALLILPIMIVIQAIMLPFQLKFGGEKGRIAMIGAFGILAIIGIMVVKGAKAIFNVDIVNVFNTLPTVSMGMAVIFAIIIALAILLVSMKISISIMNKKEL